MKINIHMIGQYTDSKLYYIARLQEIKLESSTWLIVSDGISTKTEAMAIKKKLDKELENRSDLKN